VKGVSGLGLMLGIETERDAGEIVSECLEKGVIVLTAKKKVRLLPPLNISYEELDKALTILLEVISK
jgi:acetylornithine/N-succinyldiaminopimelate aminotransferase